MKTMALRLLALCLMVAGARPNLLSADPGLLDPTPQSVELAREPAVVESLGLSIRPPANAVVARELGGGGTALLLADRAEDPRWRLRIRSLSASSATPTARTVALDHVLRLRNEGTPFTEVADEPTTYGGVEGHLLVVAQADASGAQVVNGWLILHRGGLAFTVATLATTPEHLPVARAALEASLGTLTLTDLDSILLDRVRRIDAGDAFASTLTPERLRTLVGRNDWYRLFTRSPQGSESELGYIRISVAAGRRGELNPRRAATSYTVEESEEGLLVIAQSRGLLSPDVSHVLDVEARYWMAWDRSSEAWSSRSTERQSRDVRSYAQTGVRTAAVIGQPSTLTVINSRLGAAPTPDDRPMEWTVPTRGYLCAPEAMLLGQLLPRDATEPLDLAFFAFDAREKRLSQRRDRWQRSDDGVTWTLTTQPGPDEPLITQIFDESGNRVRRLDGDGVIVERIEPLALQQLWKSKGLPTSDPDPPRPSRR